MMRSTHEQAASLRVYLISLGAGLIVGLAYSVVKIPAPAPPLIALVGLLGMVVGEQLLPIAQKLNASLHVWK